MDTCLGGWFKETSKEQLPHFGGSDSYFKTPYCVTCAGSDLALGWDGSELGFGKSKVGLRHSLRGNDEKTVAVAGFLLGSSSKLVGGLVYRP